MHLPDVHYRHLSPTCVSRQKDNSGVLTVEDSAEISSSNVYRACMKVPLTSDSKDKASYDMIRQGVS